MIQGMFFAAAAYAVALPVAVLIFFECHRTKRVSERKIRRMRLRVYKANRMQRKG